MEISLDRVTKLYSRRGGVEDVSLTIRHQEFLTLMGSSGAGKSTLLHLISGALQPDSGEIRFDGRDVASEPAERRPLHTVFQGLHLFPHLNVEENVAFALQRARPRPSRDEIRARAARLLEQMGLAGFGPRPVHELSGGEKQRVAIARALIDGPQALLLDEPFAPLDRSLKETMVELILSIKRRFGITIVLTTHDWYEALKLSDRIAVVARGRVAQVGTPEDLYHRPKTAAIARLTGPVNIVTGRMADGAFSPGPGETYAIRPAFVRLEGPLEGVVEEATFAGDAWHLRIRVGDALITAEAPRPVERETPLRLALPPEHLVRLSPDA